MESFINFEAEECAVGSLMIAASENRKDIYLSMQAICRTEMFHSPFCSTLWSEISKMIERNISLDAVTLMGWLRQAGLEKQAGGVNEITRIVSSVPGYSAGPRYAEMVRDRWVAGEIATLCSRAQAYLLSGGSASPQEVGKRLTDKISGLVSTGASDDFVHIHAAAERHLKARRSKNPVVVPSGIDSLDRIIGGFPIGGFSLVCGRPGSGKSLLGRQIAVNCAAGATSAAIITVEETVDKVATGVLSSFSSVENNRLSWGSMEEAEFEACEKVTNEALRHLPLWINDRPTRVESVAQSIATAHSKYKIGLAVVDYLQLIEADGENQNIRVGNTSRTLKNLAKSLNIPIVACCQLSRKNESEGGVRRPRMSDLRDSGSIEQDGDVIVMMHREDYYRYAEQGYTPTGEVEMIVTKSKCGPIGVAIGQFEGKYQRITERDSGVF